MAVRCINLKQARKNHRDPNIQARKEKAFCRGLLLDEGVGWGKNHHVVGTNSRSRGKTSMMIASINYLEKTPVVLR